MPGMHGLRAVGTAATALAVVLSGAGCGFLGASNVSHTKPNGFVLRGHVTVPLPAGQAGPAGSPCTAGSVGVGTTVTVTDPAGKKIATGALGAGVVALAASSGASPAAEANCDFPFQIRAVPGGVTSYGIAIGDRPPQTFPAENLHQDQAAVITLSG